MSRFVTRLLCLFSLMTYCSLAAAEDYKAYLFAYFTGNGPGQEQVHYAISEDGFDYKALNGNRPVLDSAVISSTGGVRDPHLLRGHDGESFYMVLTDLYVPKMGWNNTKMIMLRSDDLVEWTHSVIDIPKLYPDRFGDVNRVWAPQTIYDAEAGKYMVYFSMIQPGGPDIIYYAYANDDFTGLATEPKQLYFAPGNHACIDADIVEKDGHFYLFHKAESGQPGIYLAVSDKLTEGYELVSEKRIDRETAPVEGSGTFKLIDQDAWILMYDVYTSGRYQFTVSDDLRNFEVVDERVSMNFHPRHGSVLPITAAERDRLLEEWPIQETQSDDGWGMSTWQGSGEFSYEKQDDETVLKIESQDGGDIAWTKTFPVEPRKRYELSGMIRTESLEQGSGQGALLNVHGMDGVRTRAIRGNRDWTEVRLTFNSGTRQSVMVNCLFGGWGQSTGTAWYKSVKLREIGEQGELEPITIDALAVGPEMSELIYAQFIEHMGRCIYGGIWAEMLEDRKFYHPISADYNPYGNDAKFPPIVRSPWQILGPADAVTMSTDKPFVGDHDPQLGPGVTIQQHGLGVIEGKQYTGYIWLKAVGGNAKVNVSLDLADQSFEISPEGDYEKYEFEFTASKSSDKAMLRIEVEDGTVRVGTLSLMPADNIDGMRRDTLALLQQLNSPLYRWPGGNFVSGYDWRDGIGDRDRRPPRTNPAWTGVEHNDFGMHEFIRFCELLNSEPLITINMGFEGAFSAEAQFDYANGSTETVWGARRAANGSEEPFGVKYWCIGNEMWGDWQLGFMSAEDYQIKHNWVADRLRKTYPDFIGIGSGDAGPWSRGLLENCADRMDLIAEHFYIFEPSDNVPQHVQKVPNMIRRKADFHRQTQAELPNMGDRRVPIAMTEWNYWYGPHPYGELGTVYYLKDALGIAAGLHEYARSSDIIGAAFYAQTVNVIGCIKTTKTDAFLAATALPLIMYREHFGTIPLELETATALASGIDVAAALTADRKSITIAVVNANESAQTLELPLVGAQVTGRAEKWWFAGDDPMMLNSAEASPLKIQSATDIDLSKPVEVPGYSATIFVVPVGTASE